MDVLDRQPEGRIYLIPVRLDECQVPTKLNKLHWVNFFDENGEEQLLKAIETGCKKKIQSKNDKWLILEKALLIFWLSMPNET